MRILFITPYPFDEAPSQRFRFEQYYDLLKSNKIEFDSRSFFDQGTWEILYKPGHKLHKVFGTMMGFVRRMLLMFTVLRYDKVFIHREATPIGPPIFEWIIAKVLRKRIIYDFDAAIWLSNTSANNTIVAGIKWHGKVGSICKWSWKVSCGNDYLCDYARQFNTNVFLNPTTINTEHYHNRIQNQETDDVILGWTGTHSTVEYLEPLVPVLQKLEQKHSFKFVVISNREPQFQLRSLVYVPWEKDSEISDLLRFHVGIMPLTDDKWAKGKCGFKALQYMALGMPAVASPVGVNTKIIDDGINGYLCETPEQWENALTALLTNRQQRVAMGKSARKKIEDYFSVRANSSFFLSMFT